MSSEGPITAVLDGQARWSLSLGDCRDLLRALPDASVHSCCCDPPYELGFMGSRWDSTGVAYDAEMWREVLRVLKPGGHILAFGGTRTYHRMACAIEDAGADIRDCIMWLYASGFPKSLNVSKAIDAADGLSDQREIVSSYTAGGNAGTSTAEKGGTYGVGVPNSAPIELHITRGASERSRAWDGWGTALKPAVEPIVMARKPLIGTVVENVHEHGTGSLNVDGCRLEGGKRSPEFTEARLAAPKTNHIFGRDPRPVANCSTEQGRWPANVIHDGSSEVLEAFGAFGERPSGASVGEGGKIFGKANGGPTHNGYAGDSGSAARFFFCAKASRAERELGCEHLPAKSGAEATHSKEGQARLNSPRTGAGRTAVSIRNTFPTVKPLALMRYLMRLITPPGGIVLDPFAGSGTGGMAALLEGFRYVGMELCAEHIPITLARIRHVDGYGWTDKSESDGAAQVKQLGLFAEVGS